MGRKKTPGLVKRNGIWHIDKIISGRRVCQSCGTGDLQEADAFLNHLIEEKRQATIYGNRPVRTFEQTAATYILKSAGKKSLTSEISKLNQIMPYIGHMPIHLINNDSLEDWIAMRVAQGRRTNTINHGLKVVRRVLNVAASKLKHDGNLTWLHEAPSIELLKVNDQRPGYPINWDEQAQLLDALPSHLREMAHFMLNTGCRDQEVCHLRWEWEFPVDGLDTTLFVIPPSMNKGGRDRVIVMNSIATEIIERMRGQHPEFVFSYRGNGLYQMNNSGWKKARNKIGLPDLRVHDLRHTFSTRLRALGTSLDDRMDLLGHKSRTVTEDYAHLTGHLLDEVEKVCPDASGNPPKIILFRVPREHKTRIFPADKKKGPAK